MNMGPAFAECNYFQPSSLSGPSIAIGVTSVHRGLMYKLRSFLSVRGTVSTLGKRYAVHSVSDTHVTMMYGCYPSMQHPGACYRFRICTKPDMSILHFLDIFLNCITLSLVKGAETGANYGLMKI